MHLIQPTTNAADLKTGSRILAIQERGMGAETEVVILEVDSIFPIVDSGWPSDADRIPGSHLPSDARAIFTLRGYGTIRELELNAYTPLLVLGAKL